uniref:PPM-type phosphatase domain-containing protein n=1 Tax=Mucochytrium quahogii TaxID=96639 RepID=A0A7S2RG51_9STRA|mmetsp:Transcript_13053/g.21135  ORF Transcript_13053/g.21135 Transcript_13053/m.21135 type:complete len:398 (+) Transcript_13053:210-1403(+)
MGSSSSKKDKAGKGDPGKGNGTCDGERTKNLKRGGESNSKSWADVSKNSLGITQKEGSSHFKLSDGEIENDTFNGVLFSCLIQGFRKDQDRFVCIPELVTTPKVSLCGLFDGHGKDGDMVAENVATVLPQLVRDSLVKKAKPIGDDLMKIEADDFSSALKESYMQMQESLDKEFEANVVGPTMKLKKEIEAAQNTALGEISMPLGSGTTSTLFLMDKDTIYVAHVGDSRAVLCSATEDDKVVTAEDLTTDQNMSRCGEEELARIENAGGTVFGKYVAGDYIDGMLQLTRSLGDCPLHRQNIVSHEPVVRSSSLTSSTFFCLAATDGIWDQFSSLEACQYVYDQVRSSVNACSGPVDIQDILLQVSRALGSEAAKRATNSGHQSDDVSVLILVISQFW